VLTVIPNSLDDMVLIKETQSTLSWTLEL